MPLTSAVALFLSLCVLARALVFRSEDVHVNVSRLIEGILNE